MAGYLFVHFIGEGEQGEQVYFSLSRDGMYWKDLNNGKPVLTWNKGEQGVRDPFLVRDERAGKYYLIATDLCIHQGKGWQVAQYAGSRDLIVWESEDLVNWSEPRNCTVGVEGAGCVWAPEAIFDRETNQFFVFWASMTQLEGDSEPKQRIYASYTHDFKNFSQPFVYMERENHLIDTTMAYENGWYYRVTKDETTKRLILEKGQSIRGEFEQIESEVLRQLEGVEGPEMYLLPDEKTWCLIADRFATHKGYLPLLCTDLQSGVFAIPQDEAYDMGQNQKRHGGVLRLTDEEYMRLWNAYTLDGQILEGQYADPDIAFFNGKVYLYPTTDGFDKWSGTEFYVFSSQDGKHYTRENRILDLASEQVPWAIGSAWAPCIAHKNGKYYFYFCGKMKNETPAIGVAVADVPEGPFTAQPEPLLTMELMEQLGIKMGQTIDPSIYVEGEKTWLLFGNTHPAIVQLTDDMVGILLETMQNLEGAYDFREAITVFKRDGIYHFTWSCDDTGSEDYHVNYGISDSLYGPIEFKYPILEKRPDKQMFGTGHHCITKVPEEDRYVIGYHRFATPVKKYPEGKGYHREVCLAEITFGEDGLIQPVEI